MTAPIYVRGRPRHDRSAAAAKAALVVVDEKVTRADAMARFGIGWSTLRNAIRKLRKERGITESRSRP